MKPPTGLPAPLSSQLLRSPLNNNHSKKEPVGTAAASPSGRVKQINRNRHLERMRLIFPGSSCQRYAVTRKDMGTVKTLANTVGTTFSTNWANTNPAKKPSTTLG